MGIQTLQAFGHVSYPRLPPKMPPKYEKWLPKFSGNDVTNVEEHMSNFWAFFQLNLVDDEAEDLVMKLFSATLHDTARRWYDSLPIRALRPWIN
jgi:hypothetical protein